MGDTVITLQQVESAPPAIYDYVKSKSQCYASDLIGCSSLAPFDIMWIEQNIDLTRTERDFLRQTLKIVESYIIYGSYNIGYSESITNSTDVQHSKYVFNSQHITDSIDVNTSSQVSASKGIFNSQIIYGSEQVVTSVNVEASQNVVKSKCIVNSQSVIDSDQIYNSSCIHLSSNLINCHSCTNCKNLTNSLFCYDLDGGEYMIFNKPVSPIIFEQALKMFNRLMDKHLAFTEEWPDEEVIFPHPHINLNLFQYYTFSDDCMRWMTTLPNYDSMMAFHITSYADFISRKE